MADNKIPSLAEFAWKVIDAILPIYQPDIFESNIYLAKSVFQNCPETYLQDVRLQPGVSESNIAT